MHKKKTFLFVGNGSYLNKGCEAITRGTVRILRETFGDCNFVNANFENSAANFMQAESDDDIIHSPIQLPGKLGLERILWKCLKAVNKDIFSRFCFNSLSEYIQTADAVLSLGGDNYSLDYGKPVLYTMLDDFVLKYKKPIVIWGASVGPFDRMPDYEKYMISHLKKVTGIFVRETMSLEYLESKGIKDNVEVVADPAFLLKPSQPAAAPYVEEGAIGLNLSPIMARYLTNGNSVQWVELAAKIIHAIFQYTGRKIYLIPHVTSPHSNDYIFLKEAASLLDGTDAEVVDGKYNAAEIKWIISKMAVFAGARTHSTIAAISSCVPTLSFAYSIKSEGINRDIFGHNKYCIFKEDCLPQIVAERIKDLLENSLSLSLDLKKIVPEFESRALSAGKKLSDVCG